MIISIPCGVFLTMYWDPWMPLGDGLLQQTGDGAGGNLTKFFFSRQHRTHGHFKGKEHLR